MNSGRSALMASHLPANSNARRPHKNLKVATSSTTALAERSKNPAALASRTVTRAGSKPATVSSNAQLRTQSTAAHPSPVSTTASGKTVGHEGKKEHHALLPTTSDNTSTTGRAPPAATTGITTTTTAAPPLPLAKQRSGPSRMSSSPAVPAVERRSRSLSVTRKRQSKELTRAKARTAGIKLPSLSREEESTTASGSESTPTIKPNSDTVSPTSALSSLCESSLVQRGSRAPPPPLQHRMAHPHVSCSTNSYHHSSSGASTHTRELALLKRSPSLAPVSPTSNSTSTSLSRVVPVEHPTALTAATQPETQHSSIAPHGLSPHASVTGACSSPSQTTSTSLPQQPVAAAVAHMLHVAHNNDAAQLRGDPRHLVSTQTGSSSAPPEEEAAAATTTTADHATHKVVGAAKKAKAERECSGDDAVSEGVSVTEDIVDEAVGSNNVHNSSGDDDGEDGEGGGVCTESPDATATESSDEEESDVDDDSDDDKAGDDVSDGDDEDSDGEEEDSDDEDEEEEEEEESPQRKRRGTSARQATVSKRNGMKGKALASAGTGHNSSSSGSTKRKEKKGGDNAAPVRIRTKISREGDMNVKVVHAVRTRHCFNRFVREIMTRFGFAKATDFDMYCIDPTGDRVDIDVEEDFDQLLDNFEATMTAAGAADVKETPPPNTLTRPILPAHSGSGSSTGDLRGMSVLRYPSPSSGFGATGSMMGGSGVMEDDGKSSTSVLRLYVRYSNAYYVEHGYPERPRSPSAANSLYASSNAPHFLTDPNVASFFTNQLQQLSSMRPTSNEGWRSADQITGPLSGGTYSGTSNSNAKGDASSFTHTLLGSAAGSVSGTSGMLLRHGAGVHSSHLINTGLDTVALENTSLGMLTETQRSTFTGTFVVDESELVEWRRMSVLGKGSFGTVYEGITMDGKMIAVKVQELPMDDDAAEVKALQTEINLMRSLKHRNIVAYYGCQTRITPTGNQQMEIFLELCHGGSLATLRRKLIKTQHTFGISLVRSYTRQVLEGLAYLHAQHVIHRDIKSDNVLISATGEAKLADFGCSKRLGGATIQANPTTLPPSSASLSLSAAAGGAAPAPAAMYQTMVGSPFFMAPEVMREDEGGYTSAADIWSVGCLVIELLGREPWGITGTNVFQILFRIAREQGMPTGVPPNCPHMLHSFFERCFERDAAKRATAAELLEHEWITCPDKLLEEVPPR